MDMATTRKPVNKPLIAFLYNVRHRYPDPKDPSTYTEADYDDPQAIEEMVSHLKHVGYNVLQIEADEKAYLSLYSHRYEIYLALNYSLGIHGKDRYAHIPAMCEMLGIPYTGASPLTQALVMNKAKAKQLCKAYGIPTLPYQLFSSPDDKRESRLSYPLIVKPVGQGSSAGITNDSVVRSDAELKKQVTLILKTFHEPALVEPFLTGREFSIAMLGNPPKFLPIIESNHAHLPKGYQPLDSLEVKWYVEEEKDSDHLLCPAKIDTRLRGKLENMGRQIWEALDIKDLSRIDIRCDEEENPFFLEINSPPGLTPPEVSKSSYFPFAARVAGMDYDELIKTLISAAETRYGLRRNNK